MQFNPIGVAAFKAAVIANAFYVILKALVEYFGSP
jgi:hypothetical protein